MKQENRLDLRDCIGLEQIDAMETYFLFRYQLEFFFFRIWSVV